MAAYTIEDAHYVAKILKLAALAVREAMYSDCETEGSRDDVIKDLLETLDGTQAQSVVVAKQVIDVIKSDLAE